ncbi:Metallo-dependent phosphatase-like protein [Sordaria sp. MPI-SDFR-AT-0083]|nr:Metallo-dependent phosphatase-like protein [Sordaria sp. MPI-SDFR-AT-0083]
MHHHFLVGSSFTAAATVTVTLFLLALPDRHQTRGQSQSQSHVYRRNLVDLAEPPPLTFSPKDGTFQISVFEDLHFGKNAWEEWGAFQDSATARVMNTVLDAEASTDLVVLNGDLISGENTYRENSTRYVDQIVEPMVRRGMTWASTYGNHDTDFNLSRTALWEEERKWLGSRTGRMVDHPEAGISNYYLPVYPAECGGRNMNRQQQDQQESSPACECDTPSLILWFFDSRGGRAYQSHYPVTGQPLGEQNWVHHSVVGWFKTTRASINAPSLTANEKVILSIGFVHIPTAASLAFQRSKGGVDASRQPGINDNVPLSPQGQEWCKGASSDDDGEEHNGEAKEVEEKEGCDYGDQYIPFMQAIAAASHGMMALFSGHDHGNSWCYKWDGKIPGAQVKRDMDQAVITAPGNEEQQQEEEGEGEGNGQGQKRGVNLCFGQRTGYGGYGSWIRGSRQIVVHQEELEEFVIRTHIRLENGEVVGAVTLNGTYGEDRYPVTRNERTHLVDSALEDF